MTHEERAALIMSQTACMLAEMEGMKALNIERAAAGHSIAYDEEAFCGLPDRYGLGYNAVMSVLQGQ